MLVLGYTDVGRGLIANNDSSWLTPSTNIESKPVSKPL